MKHQTTRSTIFELSGVPALNQAFPLALQHVVAMIVGCVTPAIIVSGVAGLSEADSVILIQAALVTSALATLLQLFPFIKTRYLTIGSGLPVIMGISFAYVPSMQSIAEEYDVATILGAMIAGGIVAVFVGLFIRKIRKFFPPLITGTVVFTIGLSLYPTAINYMAGGVGSEDYGSWQNWLVAILTLTIVTVLNHFGKGIWKLASILIGIIGGYIIALFFGMVDFSPIHDAALFQVPSPLHFGIRLCRNRSSVCNQLHSGNRRLFRHNQRRNESYANRSGTAGRNRRIWNLQYSIFSSRRTPDCYIQPERGNRCNDKSYQPLCTRRCGTDSVDSRSDPEILVSFNDNSVLCTRRCHSVCFRIHRHDRNETDHITKYDVSQYFHRGTCGSTGNGNLTGK